MLFNSYSFLFFFLPTVVLLFFSVRNQFFRLLTIITASLIFYGLSGIEHAIVLSVEIAWVYWITSSPAFVRNPLRLFLCIAPVLLALIHYKYVTFIVADVLLLKPNDTEEVFDFFANAVLPAGISFFTFQLSSFAIDRYRGQVQEAPTLMIFAAYISFFPQLIAGPIVRYHEIE